MHYTLEELRAIPIFFIVGKGRSGTTLLSTILDSHPSVASATESRFLLLVWQKYKSMKRWKPEMAEEFIKDIQKDFVVKNFWNFRDDFIDNLKQLPPETTIQDLIKTVYVFRKTPFQKDRIKFIIDKNPRYTLFIDKLNRIFPDANFFRLIRDPRDNITSHLKYGKKPTGMLAHRWLDLNHRFDKFSNQFPAKTFTQRFEDLILDKNVFFRRFEKYTGIDSLSELEEKRITFKDQIEERFNERLKDQHQASFKPLNSKKIGHYKVKLSEDQIQIIDNICFPYAEKYDYTRESASAIKNVNPIILFKWRVHFNLIDWVIISFYSLPFSTIVWLTNFLLKYILKRKK